MGIGSKDKRLSPCNVKLQGLNAALAEMNQVPICIGRRDLDEGGVLPLRRSPCAACSA